MKGSEARNPASRATGSARPTAGPRIASRRTIRKPSEATTTIAEAAREVAASPGSRMATVQIRIRIARPTGPSRNEARVAAQRKQHRPADKQGGEQDYPCREVGPGEEGQEGGEDMESAGKRP